MFHIDWSDPQTLWLNVTNLLLGLATVLALGFVVVAIGREWILRRRRAREIEGLDAELEHMLDVPELGMTMADGGEPRNEGPRK